MSGARGEGVVQLADRDVEVLFTNRALAAAETAIGKSVLGVVNAMSKGDAAIGDLAHLLQAGMEAARRDGQVRGRVVTLNDAYEVLDGAGFTTCLTVVIEAVASVISYSRASTSSPSTSSGTDAESGDDADEKNG